MEISDEMVQRMKGLYKENGKDISDEEARNSAHKFTEFIELLYGFAKEDAQKKRRLKKEPNGFPVNGRYSCLVCGNEINEETGWYSWYGQTCLLCRDAISNGVVPSFVCTHRDSYYSTWYLKDRFNIKSPTMKKLIKEGKMNARIILNRDGKVHEYLFLKKENPKLAQCDPKRKSPGWKSFERNREKKNKRWAREKTMELKKDIHGAKKKMGLVTKVRKELL